jgi:hypothetical protein
LEIPNWDLQLEAPIWYLQFRQYRKRKESTALECLSYDERQLNLMTQSGLIPVERIERAIYLIRGEKVMLDRDLAALYGVETKALKQAVRRNIDRFPSDFMFVLDATEFQNWRSQFVTSNSLRMGLRHPPMAFTEHGILMLSTVLNSKRAIQVNIEIMRAFVRLRQMLASNAELARRLDELEGKYDRQFKVVFDAVRTIMSPRSATRQQIGFRPTLPRRNR